jgi:hypothetical protein
MAFKLKNTPYPKDKKPKRRKNKNSDVIEPQLDPSIFGDGHVPYSVSSLSREVVDKKYYHGEGFHEGLESKLTFNPKTQVYTRTQIESSPAMPKRKKK